MRVSLPQSVLLVVVLLWLEVVPCDGGLGPRSDGILNVHLVCHTHDDTGWQKTVDEYYYGANNSIQDASVQLILDSVTTQLELNPDRKFIYVEIAFFWRWWNEQSESTKALVKTFVQSGQLEFINGGWCMNDEAATHYNDIVDQMTMGHHFLLSTFGVIPSIGWHIDPFGHSSTMASLMRLMEFDGFYFGRIDYQDKDQRKVERTMEMMWRGSPSLGERGEIFTGVTYNLYQPPPGFNFDFLGSNQIPIMSDPLLEDYNVQERVDAFVIQALFQSVSYSTNNIMMTMGSDFEYMNAVEWYKNLDKLIKWLDLDGRVNAFYSTPSIYTEAVKSAGVNFTTKTDDFFSYADVAYKFWTGYFTSRPALKGYIRQSNALLQTCKQMEALDHILGLHAANESSSWEAREAMGLAQHHDAVTGTEQQHVADDYAKRLYRGNEECMTLTYKVLGALLDASRPSSSFSPSSSSSAGSPSTASSPSPSSSSSSSYSPLSASPRSSTSVFSTPTSFSSGSEAAPALFTYCPLLNISACNASSLTTEFTIVVYNPLAQARVEYERVPVSSRALAVTTLDGLPVPCQIQAVTNATIELRANEGTAPYTLTFMTSLPPLSAAVYTVTNVEGRTQEDLLSLCPWVETNPVHSEEEVRFSNGILELEFDAGTGLLSSVSNVVEDIDLEVSHTFLWYNASIGNNINSTQPSDAYVFRPNSSIPFTIVNGSFVEGLPYTRPASPANITVAVGPLCSSVQQSFGDWVSNVFWLCEGENFAGAEFTVGPIPFKDTFGKEVISRYITSIESGESWQTDANGRELQNRTRNFRPTYVLNGTEPVAQNYFPCTTTIAIKDEDSAFAIVMDRSQGGASLWSGELELMLHRRLFANNAGVNQILNETGTTGLGLVTRGTHRIVVGLPSNISDTYRSVDLRTLYPQTLGFGAIDLKLAPSVSLARYSLPPNVHLLSLDALNATRVIVRLAHVFAVGESPELSGAVTVNLQDLFVGFDIVTVEELNLTANQKRKEEPASKSTTYTAYSSSSNVQPSSITLGPMDIRTFLISTATPRERTVE